MTPKLTLQWPAFSLLLLLLFLSCKKEPEEVVNQPPIARAGVDRVITLPQDSVHLDGVASMDLDGTLASFEWTKIAGPQPCTIMSATTAKTAVTRLEEGIYQFQLTVTDNEGASARDTIHVTVSRADPMNKAPLANAGADQIITLPNNTANLSGHLSSDPDGSIAIWQWTKVAGPDAFTIVHPSESATHIKNLVEGIYQFELRVTDNKGYPAKDTVQVTVLAASSCSNADLRVVSGPGEIREFGSLSLTRSVHMAAAVADKMVFAGGYTYINQNYTPVNRVDIYNFTTKAWFTAQLSQKEYYQQVTVGNKVLFVSNNGVIDVYDALNNSLSLLSSNPVAGRYQPTIAVLGNKVFFASGSLSSKVDIYDAANHTWSAAQLSEGRAGMITAAVGNKLVFAGGYKDIDWDGNPADPSKKIDIYDAASNSWSTAELPQPGLYGSAAAVGNKAVFAFEGSDIISLYDAAASSWSIVSLSIPRTGARVMAINSKILVAGGYVQNSGESSRADIYDVSSNSWSAASMSRQGYVGWSVGVGNKLLFSTWNNTPEDWAFFEVYTAATNTFSQVRLSHRLHGNPVVADGKVFFGGASIGSIGSFDQQPSFKVWEFEFK